jgi:hypothetical protein
MNPEPLPRANRRSAYAKSPIPFLDPGIEKRGASTAQKLQFNLVEKSGAPQKTSFGLPRSDKTVLIAATAILLN